VRHGEANAFSFRKLHLANVTSKPNRREVVQEALMANELINPVVIAQETLMRLENNLTMSKFADRQYDDRYAVENEKIGF
jgi:hypothetical protein